MGASLSVAGLLAPFQADPGGSAVFTDFDGTLAPIVDDPAAARPLPGAVEVLDGLARHYGVVGVVSGRPVTFLEAQLGGHRLWLFGLYGMERSDPGGDVSTEPDAAPWLSVVETVAAGAAAGLPPGLELEHKGLSVTVHFRRAPSRAAAARRWADEQAAATGLVAHPGRQSYELRPPLVSDKGSVVARAAQGRRTVFLGDDHADLAAFDTLDRMAADGTTALKVAVSSAEAPPELLARADLVVDGPEGALSVLRALLGGPGAR